MKTYTVFSLVFALWGIGLNTCVPARAEPDPIVIGWTGPLTGNSAVLGIDSVEAARMVIDHVNTQGGIVGRKLKLVAEDDQYDTAKAVGAYNKLTQVDNAVAIIANTHGGIFATADRALRDNVVVVNPLDCNEEIAALPESTLCVATQSESVGVALTEEISKRKDFPVAILYDEQNPFMVLVHKTIRDRLVAAAHPPSYEAGLQSSDRDFRSHLTRARQSGVRGLVFLGHDSMGQAMAEARQIGITAQFYTVGSITSPGFQSLAGKSAEGALVAFWEAPRSTHYEQFMEEFKKRAKRSPILELASIPSYDVAMLIVGALRTATDTNGAVDRLKFRNALYGVKDYQGLSGLITIESDGAVRTIKERIYNFRDGKLTPKA